MYWVPPPCSLARVVVNNRLFPKQGRRQRPTAEGCLRASCMWHGMRVATFRHRSTLVYIHRTIKQIKQKILAIHKAVLSKITICGCARQSALSTLTCHEITGLLLTRNLRDMNYGNQFICVQYHIYTADLLWWCHWLFTAVTVKPSWVFVLCRCVLPGVIVNDWMQTLGKMLGM